MDPIHARSEVSTAFAASLSEEVCWVSPAVVTWAFCHNHFNCALTSEDGKIVVSNQKGYNLIPAEGFNPVHVFIIGE